LAAIADGFLISTLHVSHTLGESGEKIQMPAKKSLYILDI
jgi:hypothetical protein